MIFKAICFIFYIMKEERFAELLEDLYNIYNPTAKEHIPELVKNYKRLEFDTAKKIFIKYNHRRQPFYDPAVGTDEHVLQLIKDYNEGKRTMQDYKPITAEERKRQEQQKKNEQDKQFKKEISDDRYALPSTAGLEYYLPPFWFFTDRNVFSQIALLRVGDLQMLSVTILELFLGKPAINEEYTEYLKGAAEYGQEFQHLLDKSYHHLMDRCFHHVQSHIGEFSWVQQLELFIALTDEIIDQETC